MPASSAPRYAIQAHEHSPFHFSECADGDCGHCKDCDGDGYTLRSLGREVLPLESGALWPRSIEKHAKKVCTKCRGTGREESDE